MPIPTQRYYIEHIYLPATFYIAPKALLKRMLRGGKDFLADCYNDVLEEDLPHVQPQTFAPEDFKSITATTRVGDGYAIIIPPPAEIAYDCQMIGIANCGERPIYGTIERTAEGFYCLCSWGPHGDHHFYGVFDPAATWEEKVEAMEQLLFHPAVA